jgi:hypothetical protein
LKAYPNIGLDALHDVLPWELAVMQVGQGGGDEDYDGHQWCFEGQSIILSVMWLHWRFKENHTS